MIRFFTLLLAVFSVATLGAQEYIWGGPGDKNSEFDGGLNDWTTFGLSKGEENEQVVFYWDEDGNANAGAYAANISPIESPSVANGAAAFDSDYLDSGGTGVGQGEVPAPHIAYLVSPVIDLTDQASVTLKFNQSHRRFQASTNVEVTADGGDTWTAFTVNSTLGVNRRTNYDQVTLVDISSVAANQAAVQIRFVFNGDYYFWVIDDVSLIKTPESELALGDYYYPMNARTTPKEAVDTDTLEFWCDVTNSIGNDASGTAKAQITNDDGSEVLWETSKAFSGVQKDSTQRVYFDDVILPADAVNLFAAGGDFRVVYRVENGSTDGDLYAGDNVGANRITIDNSGADALYSLNEGTVGIGGTSLFTAVNYYRTGTLPEGYVWIAKGLTAGASGDNVDNINCTYTAGVWKIDDSVDEDLSQITGDYSLENEALLKRVGYGYGALQNHDKTQDFTVESGLLDSETDEEGVHLDPNSKYFVSVEYKDVDFDEVGNWRVHCGTSIKYFQPAVFIADADGIGVLNNNSWAWKMILSSDIVVPTNAQKDLVDATLSVYPNPATDYVNIDFELATTEDVVTLAIRDITGKLITMTSLENVNSEKVNINVADLAAGQYTVQMLTAKGYKTAKFTVVK